MSLFCFVTSLAFTDGSGGGEVIDTSDVTIYLVVTGDYYLLFSYPSCEVVDADDVLPGLILKYIYYLLLFFQPYCELVGVSVVIVVAIFLFVLNACRIPLPEENYSHLNSSLKTFVAYSEALSEDLFLGFAIYVYQHIISYS